MKVVIENRSELPIYAQIKEQVKEQIITGEIKEGAALPSIRQLAKELSISVITTTRAYNELEAEGFIATRQGKGSIVLPRDSGMVREQYLKRIEDALGTAVTYAGYAGIGGEELITMLKTLMEE